MVIDAFAKINWTLMITGIREDGYHLLDMLMQPVSLRDKIILGRSDELSLTLESPYPVASGENNLVMKAARLLQQKTGTRFGAAIRLEKSIPVQAGMGGGSSDAAAVLKGLNILWHTGLSDDDLEILGLSLGADVPFFIRGGLARSSGIGEKLEPLPCSRFYPLLVLQPESGLSTGAVFKAYHEKECTVGPSNELAQQAIFSGQVAELSASFKNVLEPVSRTLCPEIGQMVESLSRCGACLAMMTGSGSAVFGVFPSLASRDAAWQELSAVYPRSWKCETQNESMLIREDL
jgi:4-diphosphocytidyl-2-C-methyl-D-erythritol kinase